LERFHRFFENWHFDGDGKEEISTALKHGVIVGIHQIFFCFESALIFGNGNVRGRLGVEGTHC
jgi:hypothetical protein